MRNRLTCLASLVFLLSLVAPAAFGQTSGSQPPPQKKKATKVWTNDDFAGHAPEPAQEEDKKAEPAKPSAVAELEARLQQLREERQGNQDVVDQGPKQIQVFQDKINASSDPREQEAYRDTIAAIEKAVADSQKNIQEYDAKIADLEKQLKAAQRRESKTKKKPAAPPSTPAPSTPPSS